MRKTLRNRFWWIWWNKRSSDDGRCIGRVSWWNIRRIRRWWKDPFLIKESENTYYLSADLELDELYDTLDLGSPQEDRYLTVGSYIYELCEGLPEESQTITVTSAKTNFVDNEFIDKKYLLTFELVKVENRRIRELKLTVLDITDVDEEEIEKLNNENDNQ